MNCESASTLTWLDGRQKLDAGGAVANDGHGLVRILEILGPIRGVYDVPLETPQTRYIGPLPITGSYVSGNLRRRVTWRG